MPSASAPRRKRRKIETVRSKWYQLENAAQKEAIVLEVPFRRDFENHPMILNPISYIWGVPTIEKGDSSAPRKRAPRPTIPMGGSRAYNPPRQVAREVSPAPPMRQKPGFMSIPAEVRNKIYRYLVVAREPFILHDKWRRVFTRKKPVINTNIFYLSATIAKEAEYILYGENVFLYRLRDPVDPEAVVDVENMHINYMAEDAEADERVIEDIHDDGTGDEGLPEEGGVERQSDILEDEGYYNVIEDTNIQSNPISRRRVDTHDSTYREQSASLPLRVSKQRKAQRARKARAVENSPRFYIDEVKHLMRHVIIEAERNRSGGSTAALMADAIMVFAQDSHELAQGPHPHAADGMLEEIVSKAVYLQTLTVRVAPVWQGETNFSFINFFDQESRVHKAMHSANCRSLRLELVIRHMIPKDMLSSCDPVQIQIRKAKGYRIIIDRSHRRQLWYLAVERQITSHRGEIAMEREVVMERRSRDSDDLVNKLQAHIRDRCEIYLNTNLKNFEDFQDSLEMTGYHFDFNAGNSNSG